jgi:hypothetical protein
MALFKPDLVLREFQRCQTAYGLRGCLTAGKIGAAAAADEAMDSRRLS